MLYVFFATMVLMVAVAQATVLQQWVVRHELAGIQEASIGNATRSGSRVEN